MMHEERHCCNVGSNARRLQQLDEDTGATIPPAHVIMRHIINCWLAHGR
jgi:hypothetical protein